MILYQSLFSSKIFFSRLFANFLKKKLYRNILSNMYFQFRKVVKDLVFIALYAYRSLLSLCICKSGLSTGLFAISLRAEMSFSSSLGISQNSEKKLTLGFAIGVLRSPKMVNHLPKSSLILPKC